MRLLWLGCVLLTVACVAVSCTSDRGDTTSTIGIADSEPTTTEQWRSDVAAMADRIAGHKVSYRMDLGSQWLSGSWRIIEKDGEILEAQYLGDIEPHEERPTLTLSEALRLAAAAVDGAVKATTSVSSIRINLDDPDWIDEEFSFHATDITIQN